jgi:hypothetical protein
LQLSPYFHHFLLFYLMSFFPPSWSSGAWPFRWTLEFCICFFSFLLPWSYMPRDCFPVFPLMSPDFSAAISSCGLLCYPFHVLCPESQRPFSFTFPLILLLVRSNLLSLEYFVIVFVSLKSVQIETNMSLEISEQEFSDLTKQTSEYCILFFKKESF